MDLLAEGQGFLNDLPYLADAIADDDEAGPAVFSSISESDSIVKEGNESGCHTKESLAVLLFS